MHTCYSYDSETTLDEVLERARASRIGRLCVTDHDTIEGALALVEMAGPELEVVVGCEFSTDEGSQVVGLYLRAMIHERRIPELLSEIRDQGGIVLLPHPFRRDTGIFRPEMRRTGSFIHEILAQTDLVECFNGRDSFSTNRTSLAFARERGLRAVASSDAHTPSEIGSVFVEYDAGDAEDGASARTIHFPDQAPHREHPVKRVLVERYYRHQERLPTVVRSLFRASQRRYHARDGPYLPGPTHEQYAFPTTAHAPEDAD
jgi:predicted metal-dependent phosphoesterase TrpH